MTTEWGEHMSRNLTGQRKPLEGRQRRHTSLDFSGNLAPGCSRSVAPPPLGPALAKKVLKNINQRCRGCVQGRAENSRKIDPGHGRGHSTGRTGLTGPQIFLNRSDNAVRQDHGKTTTSVQLMEVFTQSETQAIMPTVLVFRTNDDRTADLGHGHFDGAMVDVTQRQPKGGSLALLLMQALVVSKRVKGACQLASLFEAARATITDCKSVDNRRTWI